MIGSTMLQISDSVGVREERIDHRRVRIGDDEHVGRVDRLPAADRLAVEAEAVLEECLLRACAIGIVVCCQMPRKSMNLKSTILAPFFSANFRTSAGVMDVPLLRGCLW